ncbi:MAG TPA: L,D-transpeptidase family protein [Gammaproteobacteria bacterium]|nr:L,D-transpeptidase family protein [Gammaproteobacteria bacterium]
MNRRVAGVGRLLVACVLAGCAAGAAADTVSQRTAEALRYQLTSAARSWGGSAFGWADLDAFYKQRRYRPVWCGPAGLNQRARVLIAALRHAGREGLDPGDYHINGAEAQCARQRPAAAAWVDILLTNSFFGYSRDVSTGRPELRETDPKWFIPTPSVAPVKLLESALSSPGGLARVLRNLPPPDPGYRRLRAALARYRAFAARGGWPDLPPGSSLKEGMRDPRVALLRQRLRLSGDLSDNAAAPHPKRFGPPLQAAVERFQQRYGLDADGVVGPLTRAALNVPAAARVEQIRLNMERWRWLPRDLGARYVMVNMAGFQLRVADHGHVVLEMPVIVGKPYRSTPAFSSTLSYLVFNPGWTVPRTIALQDMLPRERRNPDYLNTEGIEVFSGWSKDARRLDPTEIDWSRYGKDHFPFRLYQPPGPTNPLGRVKFMFPNPFDVYMHDTPARELFNRSVRTFSSGCIRVAKPLELAAYLLSDAERSWTVKDVQAEIDTGETRAVHLPRPLPIYLVYWTAWADADGVVHFRDDVYGRDRRMQE